MEALAAFPSAEELSLNSNGIVRLEGTIWNARDPFSNYCP